MRARKITVWELMAFDGVLRAPEGEQDTEGGFTHSEWAWPYWHDDIGAHFLEVLHQSDEMLLGCKTWQMHARVFESMDAGNPFSDAMPKYGGSTMLKATSAWRNSNVISLERGGGNPQSKGARRQEHVYRRQQCAASYTCATQACG